MSRIQEVFPVIVAAKNPPFFLYAAYHLLKDENVSGALVDNKNSVSRREFEFIFEFGVTELVREHF